MSQVSTLRSDHCVQLTSHPPLVYAGTKKMMVAIHEAALLCLLTFQNLAGLEQPRDC